MCSYHYRHEIEQTRYPMRLLCQTTVCAVKDVYKRQIISSAMANLETLPAYERPMIATELRAAWERWTVK